MNNFEIQLPETQVSESQRGLLQQLSGVTEQLFNTDENRPSQAVLTLRFGSVSFRKAFDTLRELCTDFAAVPGVTIKKEGRAVSPSYLVQLFETVAAQEEAIRKEQADESLRPDGWGYAALDAITRYLPENREALLLGTYWFSFGHFVSEGVWKVDKHQILAILRQQVEDKHLYLCPSFDFSVTEGIIGRLPDQIDTNENANWSVFFSKEVEGSRIIERPKGIIHKLTRNGSPGTNGSAGRKGGSEAAGDQASEKKLRNIPKVRFDEIGGIDGIITQVREVIELPLKNPGLFRHLGIKPHKGMMLYGEPGCGKTMVAKAIANEVEAHFISVKGPELINKYQGASEENLRKLFDEAREMQPSIIFFDEMDAVAQRRSDAETLRTDARFVNQLLSVMDGVEDYGRVCVIGATNRIELIDPALLRPGRFDYQLEVKKPDAEGCRKIFEITTQDMPFSEAVDRSSYGLSLQGLTGAEIAYIAREAAYNSLRRHLNMAGHFDAAAVASYDYSALVIEEEDLAKARESLLKPANDIDRMQDEKLTKKIESAIAQS
ncbi:ATP-binding protein [Cyclonatronum proteinivorum]|nr:AAA family ATPase [Cyclonatronum proteinivorum]